MVSSSFVQTSFLGGEWSPLAQGRMTDPAYKTGMDRCYNAFPTEEGAWVRRSGSRYLAHTRHGAQAVVRSFDFSIVQPYQLEFTAGYLRFFAGLAAVTTTDSDGVYVKDITTETPARVILNKIPAGWANGDTVIFELSTNPCTAPLLCGRQFTLASKSATDLSFTLLDPITGASIDGSTIAYDLTKIGPTDEPDLCKKVFELATPYTGTTFTDVRTVQDDTSVLLLHGSFQPYSITEGDPFAIAAQDFDDGPYLDLNDTATTLALSADTGSVTVTASAPLFASTDVKRLIRFQSGPTQYAGGTTYAKNAKVTGSDSNIYTSVAGGNIGHDPTTDDGTHWELSDQTVTWTWLRITAYTNTTHVTATIEGATPTSITATTAWRLGVFSDTTGWPKCGAYHEGRLMLSGVIGNRVDGSKSNDHFNFSPTDTDGTVADDNAVAYIFNAKDVNAIFWMISTEDGLICGTQAGEWRIKASSLDDPLSPSSVQARRVSTYGCANIEPAQPGGQTVFVQRQQKKLLGHEQASANRYVARNISHLADHLMTGGIEEIAWQQEPSLNIWMRRADGILIGCTYKHEDEKSEQFQAFHQHEIFSDRSVVSISSGPAYDGLSDTLYMVTNQTDSDEPDYNVYWVEALMPLFETGSEDWAAYHVDGGANPCCAVRLAISNGDSIEGLRIYGLWHLNGKEITPYLGGLDLGDYTVSNGKVDVEFSGDPDAKFTLAFFTALSDGTDYGVFELGASFVVTLTPTTPPIAGNTLLGLVGADTSVKGSYNGYGLMDADNNKFYEVNLNSGTKVAGLRRFECALGVEELQKDEVGIFGNGSGSLGAWSSVVAYDLNDVVTGSNGKTYISVVLGVDTNTNHDPVSDDNSHWHIYGAHSLSGLSYKHPDGYIYAYCDTANRAVLAKINATTLVSAATFGTAGSSFAGTDATHIQMGFFSMAGPRVRSSDSSYRNFVSSVGIRSAAVTNEINVIDADNMSFVYAAQIDEPVASITTGLINVGRSTWYAIGHDKYSSAGASNIGFYEYSIDNDAAVTKRKFATFTPPSIDATWTNVSGLVGPVFDKSDGNILFMVETTDVVATKKYLVKVNTNTGAIMWKYGLPSAISSLGADYSLSTSNINGVFAFYNNATDTIYEIDTSLGTATTVAFNVGMLFSGSFGQYFDYISGSLTFFCDYTQSGTPIPTYLGAYLAAHSNQLSSQWGRLFLGTTYANKSTTTYTVPASVGFTFTSEGQLLRPDYGNDAGAANGPAFGKKRRLHWYALQYYRTRGLKIGTDFDALRTMPLVTAGGTAIAAPELPSGIFSTTIDSDYNFENQIAWRVTRPYPCNIPAIGGYLDTQDK